MKRAIVVLALCAGSSALAEAKRVRIAALPLKAVTGDAKLDEELPRRFEVRLVETKQVDCPLPEKIREFLNTRSGSACEKDAACLKTLAENTASLYALASAIRMNGAGTAFLVTATLFRVDGEKKEVAFEFKIDREKLGPVAAGDEALKQMIARLELEALERVLPLKAGGPEAVGGPKETPGVTQTGTSYRPAGIVVLAVGLGAAVTGAVLLGIGDSGANGTLNPMGVVRAGMGSQYVKGQNLQTAGGVALGFGAAAALTGFLVVMMTGETQATVAPVAGGAAVSFGGTW